MSDVLEGHDGRLFHGQGTNRWLDYLTGKRSISDATIHDWIHTLCSFQEIAKKRAADLMVWIAPEKHTVLGTLLPVGLNNQSTQIGKYLEDQLRAHGVSVLDNSSLLVEGATGAFHSKTDSHFNARGMVHVYSSILKAFGIGSAEILPAGYTFTSSETLGDLGRKTAPPRSSVTVNFSSFEHRGKFSVPVPVRNLGRVALSQCPSAPVPDKLLLFGNSFSSGGLLDLLSRTFREVLFVFFPTPDAHVICEFNPRYALFQTNERFISRGPASLGSASFRAVGLAKLLGAKEFQENQVNGLLWDYPDAVIANSLFRAAVNNEATLIELIVDYANRVSIEEACVFAAILERFSHFRMGDKLRARVGGLLADAVRRIQRLPGS